MKFKSNFENFQSFWGKAGLSAPKPPTMLARMYVGPNISHPRKNSWLRHCLSMLWILGLHLTVLYLYFIVEIYMLFSQPVTS